jgi:replicative DNA helicase
MVAFQGTRNTETLDYALRHVKPEYFVDRSQKKIFQLVARYFHAIGGVVHRDALTDMLRDTDPGTALMYAEEFDAALRVVPGLTDPVYKHSITELEALFKGRRTNETLTRAMSISRHGEGDGEDLIRGPEAARQFALAELAQIDQFSDSNDSPEGDIRREGQDVLAEYALAQQLRAQGKMPGISSSITALDELLGGSLVRNGQMCLLAGYTSAGKTALCCQIAWHAAVKQGKSVVYMTTETGRVQVRRKLVARHSREEQFGLPGGLNTKDIAEGSLEPRGVQALQASVNDLDTNSGYGAMYLVQMPEHPTLAVARTRLDLIGREFMPDLVIMDYLQLFYADRGRDSMRAEQSDIVKAAKEGCSTAFDGRGYPLISPWQIGRKGREQLKSEGSYQYESLSETQEAPQTTDMLLGLIDYPDTTGGRAARLDIEVMKNRDGERGSSVQVTADYANAGFESKGGSMSSQQLFALGQLSDMDDVLLIAMAFFFVLAGGGAIAGILLHDRLKKRRLERWRGGHGDPANGECDGALAVRIGGQQSACADITVQWQVLPGAAGGLFQDYANKSNLMGTIDQSVVVRDLETVVNNTVGDYDPITDVKSVTNQNTQTSQFTSFSGTIENQMKKDLSSRIKIDAVNFPLMHYSSGIESVLQGIQKAYGNFAVAQENVKVNQEQQKANAALGNPSQAALSQYCFNLASDGKLPRGTQCLPNTGGISSGS